MKIVVYTALFANKDVLLPPVDYKASDSENITYVVFTDDHHLNVPPYITHIKPAVFEDIAKNARYFKIIGDELLNDFDIAIWHDANIQIRHHQINELLTHANHHYLTTFYHPNRNDFYSEAMTCIRTSKDFSLRILNQAFAYFIQGMPAHKGMYSTGILIKNNKFNSGILLDFWWQQTLKYSRRDQLSLAFSIYKVKAEVKVIQENIFDNPYSLYHLHNYQHYEEKTKLMRYNALVLKKLSYFCVQLMRKIKKL